MQPKEAPNDCISCSCLFFSLQDLSIVQLMVLVMVFLFYYYYSNDSLTVINSINCYDSEKSETGSGPSLESELAVERQYPAQPLTRGAIL